MVALVVGGRHPGHYFLDSDDFNDVVTRPVNSSLLWESVSLCNWSILGNLPRYSIFRTDVCPVKISPPGVVVRRAGATARYVVEDKTRPCKKLALEGKMSISSSFYYILIIFFLSYVDGGVLLCGGRSRTVLHGDCVR